jgi:hypothetical protein
MKMLANYMKCLLLLTALLAANTSFLRPAAEELPADKSATHTWFRSLNFTGRR